MLPISVPRGHIIKSSISETHLGLKRSKPTQSISRIALSRTVAAAIVYRLAQAGKPVCEWSEKSTH
jgi:hypothetical protein